MARTQAFDILQKQNLTANKSIIFYPARNFDQIIFIVRTTALNGAPTTATLDVDIEVEAEGAGTSSGGGTDTGSSNRDWVKVQTKALGVNQNFANTTVGNFALGTFTQVTQTTTLQNCEIRGLDSLIGKTVRITFRVSFTGGATPSWTTSCLAVVKATSVG